MTINIRYQNNYRIQILFRINPKKGTKPEGDKYIRDIPGCSIKQFEVGFEKVTGKACNENCL
jgi:hypothetical protein